jgi:hypothetical protein
MEDWQAEKLVLPDERVAYDKLRTSADKIFDLHELDRWFDAEVEPHMLDLGTMKVTKDFAKIEKEQEMDDEGRYQQWDEEIQSKIENCREEVWSHFEKVRAESTEIDWRLREEEVAARERIVFEHQSKEADLMRRLKGRGGILRPVPNDNFLWSVEWKHAPQEFQLNITAMRGLRSKLRDGYYVVLASIHDRLGGQTLRFSTGEHNLDCTAALPPLRFLSRSGEPDRYINRSVDMLCPAASVLQTHAVLIFEVWQLKVGKYDPVDKVVGWGVWPLVNKDCLVVEGKFKLPLLKGEVDTSLDTYRSITELMQNNLSLWLCNLYFEIRYNRKEHETRNKRALTISQDTTVDALRLERTVDDFRGLVVAKLPPRLFFDDIAGPSSASQGLRRRYFGSADLRPLNAALWEKRSLLEEEKAALRSELTKRKAKAILADNDLDTIEYRIRQDLDVNGVTKIRKIPGVNFASEEPLNKDRDSHILLLNHHMGIISQREFFFLGRRYKDRLQIMWTVLRYELGVNRGGPWDKTKVVTNTIFAIVALAFRAVTHGLGLYFALAYLNVPLIKNQWGPWYVDIRFDFTTRFYPQDTLVTMFAGTAMTLGVFMFFALFMFLLLAIFSRFPYVFTRFWFWFGVAAFFDPIISSIQEVAVGNLGTGDPFLLVIQLQNQERNLVSGLFLTFSAFLCLMIIQAVAMYLYICNVHLNGRVVDVYNRIMFPESSFFAPHDLEISEMELRDVIKRAKSYRNEAGYIKRVKVFEINHFQTCFFRARLWKLLSVMTNEPEQWIDEYVETIPLRRPNYVKDLIVHNLGSYKLGGDILKFLKRRFPHLTRMSDYRIGDVDEDYYYEADIIRDLQRRSTPREDDNEFRTLLKAYFQAQVYGGKPAEWSTESSTSFWVRDPQLLADVIFFETNSASSRMNFLSFYLEQNVPNLHDIDEQDSSTWSQGSLPNFDKNNTLESVNGLPVEGSIVHITLENPVKRTKQLVRTFVITPHGMIIEPKNKSFSFLQDHTSDHPEFWAAKSILVDHDTMRELLKADIEGQK